MEIPVIIAVVIGVIYDQIREVNEAERPAIVKPKRFYKGKGL
jgi:regulator of protease activity HflC (stomatin/prohibitin superfamily)